MGYVSNFSPDGKLFALLNSDGKLKIWDTQRNEATQEYVPNLHLSSPCTCFIWITVNSKNKDNAKTTLYIALGTSKGGVEMYSYATSKIESKLQGNGHGGAVTSICLHNGDTLYTCGEDYRIVEWSLLEGCETKQWKIGTSAIPTCIVSLPTSNRLLVGCKELHLWSLDTYKLENTFTGHTTDVNSMQTFLFDGEDRLEEFVLTTAKSSREISLWMMAEKKKVKKNVEMKNVQATFVMEYAATCVSCLIVGNKLTIAAVTGTAFTTKSAGGNVHLFLVDDISETCGKSCVIKPKATIMMASDSVAKITPIPIITATLNSDAKDSQGILIGYGSTPLLCFENITYSLNEKIMTLVRLDPKTRLKRTETTNDQSKTKVAIANDIGTEYSSGVHKRKSSGNKKELIIEDILETLSIGGSKNKSVVELLGQALHNHDANLLREVFCNKDETVIRSTLQRLPQRFIPDLVHELTLLAQKKTAHVQIAVCWLKILLQIHASQLMALGTAELYDRFGALLGIIQHRTYALQPLSMLSGRLDLLLNQIKRNTDDDPIFNHENVLVYEDKEVSDDDVDNEDNDDNEDGMRDLDNSTEEEEEEEDSDIEMDAS